MAVIRVRKTPKSAFNPKRRPSQLLKDQVTHLEWAVRPASERQPNDFSPRMPRTEAEAAARIAALTRNVVTQWSERYGHSLPPTAGAPVAAPKERPAKATRPAVSGKRAARSKSSARRKR
jgi:hypothetical protein